MSGHMFFGGDYLGFDDALFAAARLLEIVSRPSVRPRRAARRPARKTYATPEIRVDAPEEEKFAIVERAAAHFAARYPVNTIDGVRITFPNGLGAAPRLEYPADPGAAVRGHRPGRARRLSRRGRRLARRTGRARLARVPTRPSARSPRSPESSSCCSRAAGRRASWRIAGGRPEISPAAVGFLTDWHVLRLTLDLAGSAPRRRLVHRTSAGGLSRRRLGPGAPQRREPGVPRGAHSGHAARRGRRRGRLARAPGRHGSGGAVAAGRARMAGRHLWRSGPAAPEGPRPLRRAAAALARWPTASRCCSSCSRLGHRLRPLRCSWAPSGGSTGRPAINDHARTHLGWLLTGLALCSGVGLPARAVRARGRTRRARSIVAAWRATQLVSPLLVGVALATAGLSAAWALRPRHALVAAGWIVLSFASLVGHWMVPPAIGGGRRARGQPRVIAQLDGLAYGLDGLAEERYTPDGPPAPPRVPALWNIEMIGHMAAADSHEVVAIDPAVLTVRGRPRAVLARRAALARRAHLRRRGGGRPRGPRGSRPCSTRPAIPCRAWTATASSISAWTRSVPMHRPIGSRPGTGAASRWAGLGRRVMLAWALQAGELLSDLPPGSKVDWRAVAVGAARGAGPVRSLGRAGAAGS